MKKQSRHYLLVITLIICLMTSAISCFALEDGSEDVKFTELSLNTKTKIPFTKDGNSLFYRISIPKTASYKFSIFSEYDNDSNEDFWFGLYRTQSDAIEMENIINSESGLVNFDNAETDYEIYKLTKGTYYIQAQSLNDDKGHLNAYVEMHEMTDVDLYTIDADHVYYVGQKNQSISVGYFNEDGEYVEGTITSAVSSNKKILKFKTKYWYDEKSKKHKYYAFDCKKSGKVTVTIKYKSANGNKATIKQKITVKKYPKMIRSLKFNGKTVSTNKYKFVYTSNKYKKKTAKIKITPKKGWKIKNVEVVRYNDKNLFKTSTLKKSVITKGKSFSFPKKYTHMTVYVNMYKTNSESISYEITMNR